MISLLLLAGCTPQATHPFPEGFVWGAATAGFQVEMGCPTWSPAACDDTASDWYQWVTDPDIVADPGLYVRGEPVSAGPGMWELFEDDARQMRRDRLTGFRLSLEWSRLFPDGVAAGATSVDDLAEHADPDAVARYHQVLDALLDNGIAPLVTLNHYTLPLWVHDGVACHEDLDTCEANGWLDGDRIVPLIALYAGFCAREFGDDVARWATLNEPFATTLSGYLLPGEFRSAPPGVTDFGAVVDTLFHQVEASAAMYDAVHAEDGDAEVGIVLNMVAIAPVDPDDPDDQRGAAHLDHLYHRVFLDGLTAGDWDADVDGTFDTVRDDLAGRLDWIGVNYYNLVVVDGLPNAFPGIPVFDFVPQFTWDPHPAGLAEVAAKADAYGLPIVITENGTPHTEDSDALLEAHLLSLHGAIEAGADVRGYYYWSWVDNYEWNHGMSLRFGLYRLDPDTKERLDRPVIERYRRFIRAGGVIASD